MVYRFKQSLTLYLLAALIILIAYAGYLYMPDRASASIALTNKENNVATSFPHTTGSLTWTAGARGIVAVALACPGGGVSNSGEVQVSGGGVSWNELGFTRYGSRRGVYVLLSSDTPADGTLSIDYPLPANCNGAGTPQEIQYSIDQITGFNTSDPDDTAQVAGFDAGTSLNLPDLGTIDTGDLVYAAFGMEYASDNLQAAAGLTELVKRETGGNVRSFLVGYSTTDDTPGITWDTTAGNGGVGFIINVGAEAPPADSANPNINIRGGTNWYGGDWLYRKAITINKNKVPNSDQTDFPVLVDLTDADLQARAQNDGDDILFTTSDGVTRAPHEIELYTSATGRLTAWVKVPTLYAERDTTIYMYYGNAATSSEQLITQTWNSNYTGVWHLNEGDSTDASFYEDSTSNTNHATLTDANLDTTTGTIIDGALNMSGTDYLTTNDSILNPNTTNFTLSLWFNSDTALRTLFAQLDGAGTGRSWLTYDTTRKLGSFIGGTLFLANTALTNGVLYHAAITQSGTAFTFYVNGVADGGATKTPESATGVGRLFASKAGSTPFDGLADEVRLSNVARSADWLLTEFNNQSATSTFYTIGNQQTRSTITGSGSAGSPNPFVKIRGGSSSGGSVKFR